MNRRQFTFSFATGTLALGVNHLVAWAQRPHRIEMVASIIPASAGQPTVFNLFKPNSTVTISTFTDLNGLATATFPLKRKDPSGTYSGKVTITVNGEGYSDFASVVV